MKMINRDGTAGGLQACAGDSSLSRQTPVKRSAELCSAEPSLQSSDIRSRREGLDRVLAP
jgi:hypothetical protein